MIASPHARCRGAEHILQMQQFQTSLNKKPQEALKILTNRCSNFKRVLTKKLKSIEALNKHYAAISNKLASLKAFNKKSCNP